MNDKVGYGATTKSIRYAVVLDFVPASVGAGHSLWIAATGDAEVKGANLHPLAYARAARKQTGI